MRRDRAIELLLTHRDVLRGRGVRSLRLFGSVARDQAEAESDVDLLVDFDHPPSFREYMQLRIFLEDLLDEKVDLVTETGLRPGARPYVEKDAIRVA